MEAGKWTDLEGLTVREAMEKLGEGDTVSLGSGTAYYFIGTPPEYRRDEVEINRKLLGRHLARAEPEEERFQPVGDRVIRLAYERLDPEDGGILITSGTEHGRFWTREEYARWRSTGTGYPDVFEYEEEGEAV